MHNCLKEFRLKLDPWQILLPVTLAYMNLPKNVPKQGAVLFYFEIEEVFKKKLFPCKSLLREAKCFKIQCREKGREIINVLCNNIMEYQVFCTQKFGHCPKTEHDNFFSIPRRLKLQATLRIRLC